MASLGKCLVVGGAGYLGDKLTRALLEVAAVTEVVVFDLHKPASPSSKVQFHTGDIREVSSLVPAFEGVDTVFHLASLIDIRPAPTKLIDEVNVGGTKNIIQLCKAKGVKRLVYTSSIDVVFQGKPIRDGNEDLPYASTFFNGYARTKGEAEELVLAAADDELCTCAVRPGHVYGPGDIMISTIIGMAQKGELPMRIGSLEPQLSFVYVENLVSTRCESVVLVRPLLTDRTLPKVHAHIAAATKLTEADSAVNKQAIFVTDFHRNTWTFMQPVSGH
jgi:sterol-4alpha-carboxylate 3-dehydrogenase (decarboxylating)